MDNGRKEYTFLWRIENYSYWRRKNGEGIASPCFLTDGLEGTIWRLKLYPRGFRKEEEGHISFLLHRLNGPEAFTLNFELSLLAPDGSAVNSRNLEHATKKHVGVLVYKFIATDEIQMRRKAEYLPNDTLSVRCKMWKGEGEVQKAEQISARTRLEIQKISFLHIVEGFSTLQPEVKRTNEIRYYSIERFVIKSRLYFTDDCEKKIMIEILPSNGDLILKTCELFLLDGSGNKIKCGVADFIYDVLRGNLYELPLSLSREIILSNKAKYLPEDKLSLLGECIFFTGRELSAIEEIRPELPLAVIKLKSNYVQSEDFYKPAENVSGYPSASEDMKAIYINQCLTDVELKTETKAFPAHKNVLCARSPVFKAMMLRDMKEKNTNCIQIDDLENDTVQQFLLFLYSDSLENIHWESATQLYYAADKYQIGKLKAMCSSFLVGNLSSSNASDLLLLADTHSDSKLKRFVEDFILDHDQEVFGSNGWEKLIETNPQLVIKTMHLKYKRINERN